MNKNCDICKGSGISEGWISPDGDYDFEWCDCNSEPALDTCISCNENKVSMTELYCLNCYLEKNAEIDYTKIDMLWLTQEAN